MSSTKAGKEQKSLSWIAMERQREREKGREIERGERETQRDKDSQIMSTAHRERRGVDDVSSEGRNKEKADMKRKNKRH